MHAPQQAKRGTRPAASTGRPLPGAVAQEFSARLGEDLDDVRIHTGPDASRSAASLGAAAFTVRSDVVFGAGRFDPNSAAGQRLLAHELAHVIQQRRGEDGRAES